MQIVLAKFAQNSRSLYPSLIRFLSLAAVVFVTSQSHGLDGDGTKLELAAKPGQLQRVDMKIQYYGSVLLDRDPASDTPDSWPIDVRAQFQYDQQISSAAPNPQATRYYHKAQAVIQRAGETSRSNLDNTTRYVAYRIKADRFHAQQYQAAGIGFALTQSQYELLRNPGDSLALVGLLQRDHIKVGDQWELDADALARLTSVDRMIQHNVRATVKDIEDGLATIYLSGHATADLEDVQSELDVMASLTVDLRKRMATSLRMDLNQSTPAGQLAPGFDGQIKIDLAIRPLESSRVLTRQRIATVMNGTKLRPALLLSPESGLYEIVYSPAWKLIASTPEAAILRMRRAGRLIAQCNVVSLPDRDPKEPLSLETFRKEIEQKIAKTDLVNVVDADEFKTPYGYQALKVTVDGIEDGLKVRWLYYHLSDASGRAMTLVFSHDQSLATDFAHADKSLVEHVRFTKPRTAQSSENKKR